jgi:hypothetical protein
VCDTEGSPLVSGGATALPGLYFCGMFVSPSGMLREAGIEAARVADAISGAAAASHDRARSGRSRCQTPAP